MENLYYTQPYYATPERFFVAADPTSTRSRTWTVRGSACARGATPTCTSSTPSTSPASRSTYRVDDAEIIGYESEPHGLDDVAAGKLDAFLCQETAGGQAIDGGRGSCAPSTRPRTRRSSGASSTGPRATTLRRSTIGVNEVVRALHADGTLADLSVEFFGKDYASEAAAFDLGSLEQTVT